MSINSIESNYNEIDEKTPKISTILSEAINPLSDKKESTKYEILELLKQDAEIAEDTVPVVAMLKELEGCTKCEEAKRTIQRIALKTIQEKTPNIPLAYSYNPKAFIQEEKKSFSEKHIKAVNNPNFRPEDQKNVA